MLIPHPLRRFGLLSWAAVLFAASAVPGCEPAAAPPPEGGTTLATGPASPRDLDPPAPPGASSPNLATGGDGSVVASWLEASGDTRRLRGARLEDGRWSSAITLAEKADLLVSQADLPVVAAGSAGRMYAAYPREGTAAHAMDAYVAMSPGPGDPWREIGRLHDDQTPTEHGFTSLVVDATGVLAFWLDGRETVGAGSTTLRTAAVGETVGTSTVLDDRVCDCCGTDAAMSDEGPIVVYRDRSEIEVRDISIVRRTAAGWTPPATIFADGWLKTGCPVNGPSVAASGARVGVVWFTEAGGAPRVRVAMSDDAGETFGAPLEIAVGGGSGGVPLGRVAIVLSGEHEAIVSWVEGRGDEGVVQIARLTSDGAMGELREIGRTTSAMAGGFTQLARAGDDFIALWTDASITPQRIRGKAIPVAWLPEPTVQAFRPALVTGTRDASVAGAVSPHAGPSNITLPVSVHGPGPDGTVISLATYAGQPVLVNVWATWCVPCLRELPEVARLHALHGGNGLAVVGVAVGDEAAPVKAVSARAGVRYPVMLLDRQSAQASFGGAEVPATFLFGRDGSLAWSHHGAITADDPALTAAIHRTLGGL